jgi:phosphoglycolate phosphatase/pyrophosphatase PpaX
MQLRPATTYDWTARLPHTLANGANVNRFSEDRMEPEAQRRVVDIALFDLDGTIADTLPLIYEAFDAAFVPTLGHGFTPGEIRAMFGPPDHEIIRCRVPLELAEEAINRYTRHYSRRHAALVSVFPELDALVDACVEAGIRLGVITGKSRATALVTLEQLGLLDSFRVLYAGDDVAHQKPAPDALLLALKDLGASDEDRIVMIGDSAADVVAGRRAGVRTIGVRWGSPDYDELEMSAPDEIVSSVAELSSLLLR